MACFDDAVLTDAGAELLAASIAEEYPLEFVKIVTGSGEYTEDERTWSALRQRTGLKIPQQEFGFSSISATNRNAVRLKALITNDSISSGYRITEMGIIARKKGDGDAEGILYSVAVAAEADFMPDRSYPVSFTQEYYTKVSNAENIVINMERGEYALAEDMNAVLHPEYPEAGELAEPESGESFFLILGKMKKAVSALISHIGNRNNPHGVTAEQIGLGNVDNTHDMDKPVSSAMLDALSENHEQLTDYTDKAVADLNSSLNTALANNYYNKIKVNELISGINDSLKDTSSWTGEWYPGHCITGWGFIVIIPWRTKGRKIGISRIRAFTGAGWTTNLTVSYIKTYPGCFAITCGETPEMTGGCTYVAEISFSVS